MRMKIVLGALLVFAVGGLAAQKMEPLNVKTGQWEMTVTSRTQMPIPPEALAKMTPEQRARMEERLKARAEGETSIHKECLTKEKLEKSLMFEQDRKDCTRTVGTSTGSKTDVHLTCDMKGTKLDIAILLEALNAEHVKGTIHMSTAGGTGGVSGMNMNSTVTGKWIGAVCSDTE